MPSNYIVGIWQALWRAEWVLDPFFRQSVRHYWHNVNLWWPQRRWRYVHTDIESSFTLNVHVYNERRNSTSTGKKRNFPSLRIWKMYQKSRRNLLEIKILFVFAILKSIIQNHYQCLTQNVLSDPMCILLPAYVVCRNVMFLVVSACIVCSGGGGHMHVITTNDHNTIGQSGPIQTCWLGTPLPYQHGPVQTQAMYLLASGRFVLKWKAFFLRWTFEAVTV